MKDTMEKRCQAFIENRETLKRVFKMEYSYMYPICANIFCARGVAADEEALRRCNALLKEHTGIFSNFRGTVHMAVVSMLSASPDPEPRLQEMLDNYALLKQYFMGSEYLALVALLLTETGSPHPIAETVARGRGLYERMKKEHPFLTSSEDSVFAVLLALSDKTDDLLIAEMEDCYQRLKPAFSAGNALQSVTHVLALSDGPTLEKCARVLALYEGIGRAGRKYGRHYELPVLAALSVLPVTPETAVPEMLEADAFLAGQRGYGIFSIDKKTRLMHAAMLTADEYSGSIGSEAAALSATVAMIAAQQAAMCAVIACSASSSH